MRSRFLAGGGSTARWSSVPAAPGPPRSISRTAVERRAKATTASGVFPRNEEGPDSLQSFPCHSLCDEELLHLLGLDQRNAHVGATFAIVSEPGDPDMTRVVELGERDDDLHPLAVFSLMHDAGDIAAGDVGADLLGAEVDVDGVTAVNDLL